jgi:hypothetical protein
MKIETLKNPASIMTALLLIFIGGYIAMSNQLSIGKKDGVAREISTPYRFALGMIILLLGGVIFYTHQTKEN